MATSPKICISGSTGFVGKHVCKALADMGYELLLPSRQGPFYNDLVNPEDIRHLILDYKPDIFIHLAWRTGPGYAQSPDNITWLEAGYDLIRLFYKNGGTRFVGVGTCFEYSKSDTDLSEARSPTSPSTLYGQCKLALLHYLQAQAMAYGRSWAWTRLFYLLGEDDEPFYRLIPSAKAAFAENRPFVLREPMSLLDFMDVREAGSLVAKIAVSDFNGIINVASGKGILVKDIIGKLAFESGSEKRVICEENGKGSRTIADITMLKNIILQLK